MDVQNIAITTTLEYDLRLIKYDTITSHVYDRLRQSHRSEHSSYAELHWAQEQGTGRTKRSKDGTGQEKIKPK